MRPVLAALIVAAMVAPAASAPILPPLHLGQLVVAVRDGQCDGDLSEIRRLSERPDPDGARAAYLVAHCLLLRNEGTASVEMFDGVAGRYAVLADHARFYGAVAALQDGHPDAAAARLDRVIADTQVPSLARRARLAYADVLLRLGEYERARGVVQQVLNGTPDDATYGRAWWLLGQAAEGAGDRLLALRAYSMAWWSVPGSPDADAALARLRVLIPDRPPVPTPEARVQRARRLLGVGEFEAAERELASALHQPLSPELAADAWYRLGFLRLGTQGAVYAFAQAAQPGGPDAPRALYWRGRALLSVGRRAEAWALWREIAANYAESAWAARAWLSLGLSAEGEDDLLTASRSLAALARQYPASASGDEARWRLGWLAYRQRRYGDAERQFLQSAADFPATGRAAANLYWAAKARTRRGRDARALMADVAQRYPYTYYGQRARTELGMPAPQTPPGPPAIRLGDGDTHVLFEELAALGFDRDAAEAASDMAVTSPDGNILSAIAWLRARIEEYGASVAAAEQAVRAARAREEEPDREVLMLAYPRAFWTEIRTAAAAPGVDPYLVSALIREESRFDRRAISPARAIGLMQLLPSTASGVAGSDMSPDALMDASTNIALGVKFLAGLLRRYNGDVVLALAAYNAGPGLAGRISRFPRTDPDVFIESIPFSETRAYVQRVLQSHGIYRWLYEGSGE